MLSKSMQETLDKMNDVVNEESCVYVVQRKWRRRGIDAFQFYDIYATKEGAKAFVDKINSSNNRDYDYKFTKRKLK